MMDLDVAINSLNEEQSYALNQLLAWDKIDNAYEFLLNGSAGTGKTFLASLYLKLSRYENVCVVAPTHKAKKVIKKALEKNEVKVDCMTIHALLGMKLDGVEETTGKQYLIDASVSSESIQLPIEFYENSLIVVDELSMVTNELIDKLQLYSRLYQIKILYLGDSYQLSLESERNKIFANVNNSNSWTESLTEVMRNKGIITEVSSWALERVKSKQAISSIAEFPSISSVSLISLDKLGNFIKDNGFEINKDVLLASTNRKVNTLNELVRQKLGYTDRYEVGEILTAYAPVTTIGREKYHNSTQFKIEDINTGYLDWNNGRVECHTLVCTVLDDPEAVGTVIFKLPFDRQRLIEQLSDQVNGKIQPRISWRRFHALKSQLPDLRHSYALTVHKSQGSTFDNVYIVNDFYWKGSSQLNDINPRLWYVATSRPRFTLTMIMG